MEDDVLLWLQGFYESLCDGEWDHSEGIRIETLDNPGWLVFLNLEETDIDVPDMEIFVREGSERDWVHCRILNRRWEGFGGPGNLKEILVTLKNWSISGMGQAIVDN